MLLLLLLLLLLSPSPAVSLLHSPQTFFHGWANYIKGSGNNKYTVNHKKT